MRVKKMELWEALLDLSELTRTQPIKYRCKICGHTTNQEWAIYRHIDKEHTSEIYTRTGNQVHGWDNRE